MISAKIIADSVSPQGHRITTFELVFPRMILAELNTHRLFSRNSASSRAIPFKKMLQTIEENPFIPIAWQKDHKGMQGTEYFTDEDQIESKINCWLNARDSAVRSAKYLNSDLVVHKINDKEFISFNQFDEDSIKDLMAEKRLESTKVTKQLCNRLLEPFMWHKVLLTATEFDNFFELRCPQYTFENKVYKSKKDACENEPYQGIDSQNWLQINKGQSEIHMMALAECMWDAYNESVPKQLKAGEWHIPYNNIDLSHSSLDKFKHDDRALTDEELVMLELKISTAKCARVSYTTVGEDGKEIPYEKDITLHDSLLSSGHFSPFEHCARAMSDEEYNDFIKGKKIVTHSEPEYDDLFEFNESSLGWCNNFKGWISYRYLLENQ